MQEIPTLTYKFKSVIPQNWQCSCQPISCLQ